MRRNVIYAADIDAGQAVGYDQKLVGQARGLAAHGLICDLLFFDVTSRLTVSRVGVNGIETSRPMSEPAHASVERRMVLLRAVLKMTGEVSPAAVYFRYPRCEPVFLLCLARMRRRLPATKILCEYPTFPYDAEMDADRTCRGVVTKWLDRATRPFLKHLVWRAVPSNYEGDVYGMKSIQFQNGITSGAYRARTPRPDPAARKVTMLAVGNVKAWHGYDRLIRGLGRYRARNGGGYDVTFQVVGAGAAAARELHKLAAAHGVCDALSICEPTVGGELDRLYDAADVGVGSLGIHRIGLSTVCPLKTREYCARGLPFISAHDDPDFPETVPFVLRVPPDDSDIDMGDMLSFLRRTNADPTMPALLHQYACDRLDWRVKMAPVARAILHAGPVGEGIG